MQIVHFTEVALGSFDWELPKEISKRMEMLPSDVREDIVATLQIHIQSHLSMMCATLCLGGGMPVGFGIIGEQQKETWRIMKAFTRSLDSGEFYL